MFFTWVPQLRTHVSTQYVKSLIALLVAIGITASVPWITIPIVDGALDKETIAIWTQSHLLIMCVFFVGVFIAHEIGSAIHFTRFMRYYHRKNHPTIHIVRRVAGKGMLRHTPRILEAASGQANAGALSSFICGHYIIFAGNIMKILNERERETVIAHEIAHLKHADRMGRIILAMTTGVMSVYTFALYVWALCAGILHVITVPQSIQLFKAALVIFLLRALIVLVGFAYWRAREYLADAAAIALTGWEYRLDFIRALDRIAQQQSERFPDWFLHWWPEFLRDHPRVKNRAKALGIELTHLE